jgi:threonine/homoserine/homoserine lactone efflux protein
MHTDFALFIQGLVIGFSIAAPVGPIGVLCIRRTLTFGQLSGLFSGLGAATADALYGSIVGFGLTFVAGFLLKQQSSLQLLGGLFLCYLGVRAFQTKVQPLNQAADHTGYVRSFFSTFLLTLTNPATILSFAAIFSGLGIISRQNDIRFAILLVSGVFIGSILWWLTLSTGVSIIRSRLTDIGLLWINRASGIMISGFGFLILLNLTVGTRLF